MQTVRDNGNRTVYSTTEGGGQDCKGRWTIRQSFREEVIFTFAKLDE